MKSDTTKRIEQSIEAVKIDVNSNQNEIIRIAMHLADLKSEELDLQNKLVDSKYMDDLMANENYDSKIVSQMYFQFKNGKGVERKVFLRDKPTSK